MVNPEKDLPGFERPYTERASTIFHPADTETYAPSALAKSKNSKANRIETGERSGGIEEICSVEVDEK
jgi:hypothetical protein